MRGRKEVSGKGEEKGEGGEKGIRFDISSENAVKAGQMRVRIREVRGGQG